MSSLLALLVTLVVVLRPLSTVQYLPRWLPGMRFKRDAAKWKSEINDLEYIVFESAKENMVSTSAAGRRSILIVFHDQAF